MKITTKAKYALDAVLDIANNQHKGPVSLFSVSQNQFISLSYLEQLMSKLRQTKIIKSVRGPGGGYLLNRKLEEISVFDVISSVDENLQMTQCNELKNCKNGSVCLTHGLWKGLTLNLTQYLKGITLADLYKDEFSVGNLSIKN